MLAEADIAKGASQHGIPASLRPPEEPTAWPTA